MAEAVDFEGSNVHMGPPKGMEETCGWLHVFSNGRDNVSAWKPTAAELEKLNRGEPFFITIQSGTMPDGRPTVFPMFAGCEAECAAVVADGGKVWR